VAETTCIVTDCEKKPGLWRAGYCQMHYNRLRRTGSIDLKPKPPPTVCAVDDCPALTRSNGLCSKHYQRLHLTGSLKLKPQYRHTTCTVCGAPERSNGLCSKHDARVRRHGSPDVVLPPHTVGDAVSYRGAHSRLLRARGSATTHSCVGCGSPARDWSYDNNDPDERTSDKGLRYSVHPEHYVPRCRSCHRRFDHAAA
jgi:hypothetical protein